MAAAETCRANGWKPGQLFEFESGGDVRHIIRLTAIGEESVMYRTVGLYVPLIEPQWSTKPLSEMAADRFDLAYKPIDKLPWESP